MLALEFETHQTNEQGKEIFEEYDWWKELVNQAAQKADSFEIRAWKDEAEAISVGELYAEKQQSSTEEIVFRGKLTPEILSELTEHCVDTEGVLKYFTFNLYQGESCIFSSEHYGYQVYWKNTGFAEMGFLMMLIKNHPLIKGFENR